MNMLLTCFPITEPTTVDWYRCAKQFQYCKVVIGGAGVEIKINKSKLDGESKVEASGKRDIGLLEGSQERFLW